MNRLNKNFAVLALLAAGFFFSSHGKISDEPYDWYLCERALGGLRVKLADNFTVGCWGAYYWGASYFPNLYRFDPFRSQGYDIVPGFVADLGKIIGNSKLSLGGELYRMWRNWEYDDEPSITQYRPRANIIFSAPFAGNFNMTVIQRFERTMHQRWIRDRDTLDNYYGRFYRTLQFYSFMRYRTTFKLSAPAYTDFKIQPYALYEGFTATPTGEYYYYEAEFGASFSPVKNLSIALADQIQSQHQRKNWATHQICLNVFYTLDFSKQIAEMVKKDE